MVDQLEVCTLWGCGAHRKSVDRVVDLEDMGDEEGGGQDDEAAHDAAQRGRPGLVAWRTQR